MVAHLFVIVVCAHCATAATPAPYAVGFNAPTLCVAITDGRPSDWPIVTHSYEKIGSRRKAALTLMKGRGLCMAAKGCYRIFIAQSHVDAACAYGQPIGKVCLSVQGRSAVNPAL